MLRDASRRYLALLVFTVFCFQFLRKQKDGALRDASRGFATLSEMLQVVVFVEKRNRGASRRFAALSDATSV